MPPLNHFPKCKNGRSLNSHLLNLFSTLHSRGREALERGEQKENKTATCCSPFDHPIGCDIFATLLTFFKKVAIRY